MTLPEWFPGLALGVLILGLPIVLATAFVQEGGPDHRGTASSAATTMDELYPRDGEPTVARRILTPRNVLLGGVGAAVVLGMVAVGSTLLVDQGDAESDGSAAAAREASVAVLPFANISGNPANEYFSDGISEELLNALAGISGLRVPARTSSFSFKGRNVPVREIAETLGVDHVLEGSVRRDGNRVLITAQLVDARSDTHLWSETFERELVDIFAMQREIATAIARQLEGTLSGGELPGASPGGTESTEAHQAYLRGRYFLNRRTPEDFARSIVEFERAITLDPGYAAAQADLASAYMLSVGYTPTAEGRDSRTGIERGRAAARKAVELAPDLAPAHAALAQAHFHVGEWEDTRREIERALALEAGGSVAAFDAGVFPLVAGRAAEALALTERTIERDPVFPLHHLVAGLALRELGRPQEAVARFEESVRIQPRLWNGWFFLSLTHLEAGEEEEGRQAWNELGEVLEVEDASAWREAYEAVLRFRETGDPQEIEVPETAAPVIALFWLYGSTGQISRAVGLFGDYLVRPGAYGWAALAHRIAGRWTPVGSDPRYQDLLEEAGIDF